MAALDAEDQQREIRRLEQRKLMQRRLTESALVEVASVLNPRIATPVRESDADQIYVLDQGRIIEQGTFEELAGRNGLFASMTARQTA
jgi:ABC-type multidrug transport system fused ATPase/permease subunit